LEDKQDHGRGDIKSLTFSWSAGSNETQVGISKYLSKAFYAFNSKLFRK
jgi:hypothetical protein